MGTKGSIVKNVSMVLVISMAGLGAAPSISTVYAAGDGTSNTSAVQNVQSTNLNVLSQLQVNGNQIIPVPSSSNQYQFTATATVDNSITNAVLYLKSDNNAAAIHVSYNLNGQQISETVSNGSGSVPVSLQTGDNAITITVDDGVNPADTYNLTVTREKSSNNLLQGIQLSKGALSPAFNAAQTAYNVNVANDVGAITVTPVTADTTASATINNSLATDKGVTVQLPVGKTAITITVTAENGDKKSYTIAVTRAAKTTGTTKPGSKKPGNTTTKKPGNTTTKKPSFGSKKTGYSVMGAGQKSSSSLKGMSNSKTKSATGSYSGKMTGSASGNYGTQQNAPKPSTATLSALSVSAGTWNKTFSSSTYTYHISESSTVDTVTISDTPTYSDAAVTINNSTVKTIQLGNQAKTIINVVVTRNSDKKTYVLVFDKTIPQPAVTTTTSTDTTTAADTTTSVNTSTTMNSNQYSSSANWTGRRNSGSTSFWSQLINDIKSFFSSL